MNAPRVICTLILSGLFSCGKLSPPTPPHPAARPESDFAAASVHSNTTFDSLTWLGNAQLKEKNFAGAIATFSKSVVARGNNAVAYSNLCAAYNAKKSWDNAISNCEVAIEINPTLQIAINNLQFARTNKQLLEDRKRELTLKPDGNKILQLGLEYYELQEYETAISIWSSSKPNGVNDPLIQNNIASAAILTKNFPLAQTALDRALKAEPANTLFLNNLKWLKETQSKKGNSP